MGHTETPCFRRERKRGSVLPKIRPMCNRGRSCPQGGSCSSCGSGQEKDRPRHAGSLSFKMWRECA
ncbi:hypothetical protein DESPIGER_2416 [Desulfovibrio piger]|uniref:Uncharacterized protein n=1 Tax=Desulfovibrio piger TaxID=901 RepID=A0A1K1LHQ7_9BACT|nr:hypothetical protein DESPIGER_2416 [Desulfovibrio piger]